MFKIISRLVYIISFVLVILAMSWCGTQEIPKKDSSNRQALDLKTRNTELSNEKDTVLDMFMGTGSCGEATLRNNRKFIGIELDDTYFDIAKQRIENTYKELNKQTI